MKEVNYLNQYTSNHPSHEDFEISDWDKAKRYQVESRPPLPHADVLTTVEEFDIPNLLRLFRRFFRRT